MDLARLSLVVQALTSLEVLRAVEQFAYLLSLHNFGKASVHVLPRLMECC